MRKLILALTALACLPGVAVAQQQQKTTADQGAPGAAPWPVTWTGQSVLADLRVAGSPVASGNPVPVSVGNFPATQAVSQSGAPWSVSGTVTANVGTTNGLALDASVQSVKTTLGSPFQAGGNIGNTAFGISGTLPAFAATPTFNIGTLNGAATAANQASMIALLTSANQRSLYFSEANNASAASGATVGGTPRDAGASPSAYTRLNGYFLANQSSTARIVASDDQANYAVVYTGALTAGVPLTPSVPITFRYYFLSIANGTTAANVTIKGSFSTN